LRLYVTNITSIIRESGEWHENNNTTFISESRHYIDRRDSKSHSY